MKKSSRTNYGNRGKAFEKFMENIFYRCSTEYPENFSFLRTPPEMRVVRSIGQGQFISVFSKKGPPDYILSYEGTTILADAKEVRTHRFPYSNLHWNQANHFERWEKSGNACAIIIRFTDSSYTNEDFIVPWSEIRGRWMEWNERRRMGESIERGGGSISKEEISKISFKFTSNNFMDSIKEMVESLGFEHED
tara:strand:+ start:72528 stop:73106 length:579 start_codon:yes stop_codon:yes gene_type:complete